MVKRRHKKLSNGFGSITKLKGKNRKKCYWARVTIGFDIRGKPIRKSLGLYLTWEDAYDAIKEYHQKNYNIDLKNATVKDIFDIFFENKKREINPKTKQPISKKTLTRYDGTFKNYFESIKKKKPIDIIKNDIQNIISNCGHGHSTQMDIKLTWSGIYFAAKEYHCPVGEDFLEFLKVESEEKSELHYPYSISEIKKLWDNLDLIPNINLILIMIYTGLRPSELCKIEIKNVYLKERYMIGGSKTAAGINRTIPMCDVIYPLIEKLYNVDNKYLISTNRKPISYQTLNEKLDIILKKLKMEHLPYDARHTFRTLLDNLDGNEVCINLIFGHEQTSIGKKKYVHKTLEQLLETVNLLNDVCKEEV